MVLDTSAIVAIHLKEPGYEQLIEKIDQAGVVAVGAPTLLESAMVLSSRMQTHARVVLLGTLRRMHAEIAPFGEDHFDVALEAFLRFGRGHHPAGLNFGDCMAYAVAVEAGLPLLFTGGEFAKTDVGAA
ncbi:MAG: type II toxin-antitoxin system VapC family toxin [Acidobacteria bacterium]|nr:type II toxin-antitoxin system VapC family toxin [Acidobacteriota bacterium]